MDKISSKEIRDKFLEFFKENGHMELSDSSIIPKNDPTLLFINSGMAPLKDYFTGAAKPPCKRLCDVQTCIRTIDIDSIGDKHHLTSFQMLGSWSIGDYFKEKEFGHIVNIASIAGFMPGPYMAVYYASKAFVLNFSLALREELKPYNVKVTTICPGPIDTNFWNRANVTMSNVKKKYFTRNVKQLADSGMRKVDAGGGLCVDGILYKSATVATRFVPKETLTSIVKLVNLKLGNKE